MKTLNADAAADPARRQFFAIAIFAVFVNIAFQYLLGLLPSAALHPLLRGLIETIAVALFVVPPAYYFYMRPLHASLTERLAAEKTLRKSEMHYRIVSELTTTFVFDLLVAEDGEVSLDFVSDNFYSFAGNREETRTFESLLSHFHPDDTGKLMESLRDLVATPRSMEIECRVYVSDPHELRWVALYGKSEWNEEQKRVAAIHGAVKDITERKRAEESQAKVQSLLEVSQRLAHIGSWEYELSTGRLSWSDEMYRIAGLPVGAPISRALVETFFPPDDLIRSRNALSSVLLHAAPYSTDYAIKRPDGRSIVIHNEGEMVRDEGGKALRVFGTTQDITERRLTEEALRTERKTAENDRRLVEQYLQQSQKMESIGVLAGGIAHDFNNLLAGVYGYIDLASAEAKSDVVSDYLAQAMDSIDRARGLTQQLLTFAKGGTPVKKSISLASLIRDTSQFALSGSNADCAYDIREDLWNCNVDRNQIGQVIQNIMLNAIQAMPMGGTIMVTAGNAAMEKRQHPTLKDGRYVHISIKDQGTGIPGEMLSRIFDPFFTTKTKGHGLGLAISYSIVTRHEGAITVESELGKGSTFHVYLPACDQPADEGAPSPSARHSGAGKVLVMDDEEAIRTLLSRMLQSVGYTVLCKDNGKEAVDCFEREAADGSPFSAVILDLTVAGGIGGREVCEKLRMVSADVPIFVASGYSIDPIMANPTDYGFTASIAKPFRRTELMEMFERHMRRALDNVTPR